MCVFLAVAGAAAQGQLSESYRIQPTDILVIEVVNEPQLAARDFHVSSSGEISYPYLGGIRAAGRTTVEVMREVKEKLEADYLVNAQVLVSVRDYRKQQISVIGQVNKPGLIDIPPERKLTVMQAIAVAGGLNPRARTSNIQLTREGRPEPMRFSLDELKDPEKAVYVEAGDVIFVPESRI